MIRQGCDTLVFQYDTPEQRKVLMDFIKPIALKDTGLRVTAMSVDNEITRIGLIEEAMGRYDDHYDFREAVQAIIECPDLTKWSWCYEDD